MGDTTARLRAFTRTGVHLDGVQEQDRIEFSHILTLIREGFARASKPVPRRAPPENPDGTFKPPVKILRAGQVIKSQKEPWNLNRNNPGKVLRVFIFNKSPIEIFVEVNQKKMTRPKYWQDVRAKLAQEQQDIYLRVDYARKVNGHIRKRHSFYTHVLSSEFLIYETACNIWAYDPVPIPNIAEAASKQIEQFQEKIKDHTTKQHKFWKQKNYRRTGFQIRSSIELAYNMVLTIIGGHSYPETDIAFLRKRAEALIPDLRQPWFHKDETYETEFERVRHASKNTHKFRQYKMSKEEITVIMRSQKRLLKMANNLCRKKIEGL